MKRIINLMLLMSLLFTATNCNGQNGERETEVEFETTAGTIRVRLYNDTPIHRDNFIKNVREGMYDGVTFHRVIRNFMIQTGDPETRPESSAPVAGGDIATTTTEVRLHPEILFPRYFHRRGVLAAAREGDDVNPEKLSDGYQFYIVTGRFQNEQNLAACELARREAYVQKEYQQLIQANATTIDNLRRQREMNKLSNLLEKLLDQAKMIVDDMPTSAFEYTNEMQRAYRSVGGAPWLDGEYTIFGEVVEGMKVVLDIEKVRTDANDRPIKDIRIISARIAD